MAPHTLLGRDAETFPIANRPLREHRAAYAGHGLHFATGAWADPDDIADFLADPHAGHLTDLAGTRLVSKSGAGDNCRPGPKSFLIRTPWDLLRANEQAVSASAGAPPLGEIAASAVIDGRVSLGRGSRILPGVYIEGAVVIGADCKIGPNCYLRGATAIGDGCHIGQAVEIKNCLILDKTNVGHLSYIGDSVLGQHVNLGAGTITANLRHDGHTHRARHDGQLVDTGRRKLGALIADGVHTGIHTSIYPGRTLHAGAYTLPGEVVREDKFAPASLAHP